MYLESNSRACTADLDQSYQSHWYLKQNLFVNNKEGDLLENLLWHPEKSMSLFVLSSSTVEDRSMAWQTYISNRAGPHDSGAVAVVDGCKLACMGSARVLH